MRQLDLRYKRLRSLQKVGDFILDAVDALSSAEAGSQAYTHQQLHYFLNLLAARMTHRPAMEPPDADVAASALDTFSTDGSLSHMAAEESQMHQMHFSEMLSDLRARSVWDAPKPDGSIRIHTAVSVDGSDATIRERVSGPHTGGKRAKRRQNSSQGYSSHALERDGTLTVEIPKTVQIDLPDFHLELGLHSSILSAHIYSSHDDSKNDEKKLVAASGSIDKP